jgi:copper resistance protein B
MTSRLKFALLAAAAAVVPAAPAAAQHAGHTAPAAQPQATCLPEHAAMGHCTPSPAQQPAPAPAPAPAPQAAPQSTCLPEHAAAGHCTPSPAQQGNQAADPHAGHNMPGMSATTGAAEGTNLPVGDAPPPPVPVANAADAFYGSRAMDMGRHHLQEFHGAQKLFQVLNNISEYRSGGGYGWESEGWYGGDINRFWFKTEGEGEFGDAPESAEIQGLYSHAIGPYWNVQGGLRYDFKPDPSRVYATVQLEGLAPSFFDLEGALFLSNKGEVMARAGGWYDQRITQRLIFQPRFEVDFAAQNSRDIGVGAGLSEAEIGARLRYDIRREFAPYIGVQYSRAFGRTARYRRDEGEDVGGFQLLAGVRTWF